MKDSARSFRLLFPAFALLGAACEGNAPAGRGQEAAPLPSQAPTATPATPRPAAKEPEATPRTPVPGELSALRVGELCKTVCQKTSALPCVNLEACNSACTDNFTIPFCRGELGAMLTCTAAAPLERFMCGPQGAPALLNGTCDPEQERAAGCLAAMMQNAGPRPANQ